MNPNNFYKEYAKKSLQENWFTAIIVSLVFIVISFVINIIFEDLPFIFNILSFFILACLEYGLLLYFLKTVRKESADLNLLFKGFFKIKEVSLVALMKTLYILLWTLLLIVPGIIKAYKYSMTTYLLIDRPELNYKQILDLSTIMMNGHKMRLFMLHLSFIGWFLLTIITAGLAGFYTFPYFQATIASFYEDLKAVSTGEIIVE